MKPLVVWLGLCFPLAIQAQEMPPVPEAPPVSPVATAPNAATWASVGPGQAASLAALESRSGARVIDLDLSLRQVQAEPEAVASLQKWVGAGGVVVLHTDAAQLFGLGTQAPRPRSREVASQQFLRTTGALPFGAHRLLWAPRSQSLDGQSSGFLGVRTVFAQMRAADPKTGFEGDVLVNNLGAGIPILRISDVTPNPQTLYAAVVVTYGRGVALFCPRLIETHRADGAQFNQNLRAFVDEVQNGKRVWLPAERLQRAFEAVEREAKPDYQPLLKALENALQPAAALSSTKDGAGLWLQREEAQTLKALWERADENGASTTSLECGAGLVLELVGRLELQKDTNGGPPQAASPLVAALFGRDPTRRGELFQTQQGQAHEAATRWWCGVFALTAAIPPLSTQ